MSTHRFQNFGQLYRAAYAETNPELKQILLSDVKRVLDGWAESNAELSPSQATRVPIRPRSEKRMLHQVA